MLPDGTNTDINNDAPTTLASASTSMPDPINAFIGRWWVLHTKARNEKAVAEELSRHRVQHFLPLVRTIRRYDGRVRESDVPLFPGYVFLCGSEADRLVALRTHRVAHAISVPDQQQLLDDLRQIWLVVSSGEAVNLFPRLQEGSRCRVLDGALRGLEGVVLKRTGPWRVYVAVRFLGQSAELEVDAAQLEIIE